MTFQPIKTVKQDLSDAVLREGRSVSFSFSGEGLCESDHHRLYFTCEDRMHFSLKDEPQTSRIYRLIDDSLDGEHANTRRFCLNMSCDNFKPYPKRAMTKILWPPRIDSIMYAATDTWELGIFAAAKDLEIREGGYLQLCLERWDKKPGIHPSHTKNAPDQTVIIPIPEGTYDHTFLSQTVELVSDTTACVLITVEGEGYSGEIYFEEPTLRSSTGKNACPDFDIAVPELEQYFWVGQSLSKKEWPEFIISVNGREIHRGEVFLRVHRYPSVELRIPDDLLFKEENEITFTYISHYHDTVPISIREVMILARPKRTFEITYCPRVATVGRDVCILIRTQEDDVTLTCESPDFKPISPLTFAERGIYPVRFRAKKTANHQKLTLSCDSATETVEILQMSERGEDNVICGSGDLIYIDNSDKTAVEDYLEWFFDEGMGDLITIRPAYRWGGHRFINAELWKKLCEVCEGMDAKYSHMIDGRDLPALFSNPHPDMLKGPSFLGRQLHERDGQAFYWGYPAFWKDGLFWDLAARESRKTPLTSENSFLGDNSKIVKHGMREDVALYRNVECDADMKQAYECAMDTLNTIRHGNPRHTGPSVMFKYLYQAGFDWCGAETLDSSMEPLLAFLRGAAKAYGKETVGVHHALQWGTHPHDTEPRYRRYLIALYTSYMQGVHEHNTEEGFWHLECGFVNHHRFSEATTRHRADEARFVRFVRSHTRSGRYYTPIAFLHGRYDGNNGFGASTIWGMNHMLPGEAEKSWQLMHIFYPLNVITDKAGMRIPKYPKRIEDDEPRGLFSGTPRGNLDVMPVEAGDYSDYKLLAFVGYNMADEHDLDRLYDYVEKGGILLGAWPHLSYTTSLDEIRSHSFRYLYHKLTAALTDGHPVFEDRTYGGNTVSVCVNLPENIEVLETTDDGTPLAYSVKLGAGRIILVNTPLYPANQLIRPLYERLIVDLQRRFSADEPDEITCDVDVQYTVYRQDDGSRHYYVTPVDWYDQPDFNRRAILRVGDERYPLSLPFGIIYKIVIKDGVAAFAEEETAEVISVSESEIRVQGVDLVTVHLFRGGEETIVPVDCTDEPIRTITI